MNKLVTTCGVGGGSPSGRVVVVRHNFVLSGHRYPTNRGGGYARYGVYDVADKCTNTNTFSSNGFGLNATCNNAVKRRLKRGATVGCVGRISSVLHRFSGSCPRLCGSGRSLGLGYLRGGLELLSVGMHRLNASGGFAAVLGLIGFLGDGNMRLASLASYASVRGYRRNCTLAAIYKGRAAIVATRGVVVTANENNTSFIGGFYGGFNVRVGSGSISVNMEIRVGSTI